MVDISGNLGMFGLIGLIWASSAPERWRWRIVGAVCLIWLPYSVARLFGFEVWAPIGRVGESAFVWAFLVLYAIGLVLVIRQRVRAGPPPLKPG